VYLLIVAYLSKFFTHILTVYRTTSIWWTIHGGLKTVSVFFSGNSVTLSYLDWFG